MLILVDSDPRRGGLVGFAVMKGVGAGDRIRTGDNLLGRQGLYH